MLRVLKMSVTSSGRFQTIGLPKAETIHHPDVVEMWRAMQALKSHRVVNEAEVCQRMQRGDWLQIFQGC